MRVSGFVGMGFDGKFFQNSAVAELPYSLRVGMFGNFFVKAFAGGVESGVSVCGSWLFVSQLNTVVQSSGRPRSLLEADTHEGFRSTVTDRYRPLFKLYIYISILLKIKAFLLLRN
jgi:hypothetical protein